jgi:MYXO-CTERM domain-containing protein
MLPGFVLAILTRDALAVDPDTTFYVAYGSATAGAGAINAYATADGSFLLASDVNDAAANNDSSIALDPINQILYARASNGQAIYALDATTLVHSASLDMLSVYAGGGAIEIDPWRRILYESDGDGTIAARSLDPSNYGAVVGRTGAFTGLAGTDENQLARDPLTDALYVAPDEFGVLTSSYPIYRVDLVGTSFRAVTFPLGVAVTPTVANECSIAIAGSTLYVQGTTSLNVDAYDTTSGAFTGTFVTRSVDRTWDDGGLHAAVSPSGDQLLIETDSTQNLLVYVDVTAQTSVVTSLVASRGIEFNPFALTDADDDGDGILDSVELGATGLRIGSDADPATVTDPDLADSDGDGIDDGIEDVDADGLADPGETDAADDDTDDDGALDGEDCDPLDPQVGVITWYADADGDGYGDPGAPLVACVSLTGHVSDATDCDDTRNDVHPGATEQCDPLNADEDCDGLADDADPRAQGRVRHYVDSDSDGHGDEVGLGVLSCDGGGALAADDCDDTDPAVHPGADEVCDPADTDEDCDGLADDLDPSVVDAESWAPDGDGDGYGDASAAVTACDPVLGDALANDCDDSDPAINPAAQEVCDPADTDEDCDGLADDDDPDATGQTTWYPDLDGDGYGDLSASAIFACGGPGLVATATDCDDTAANAHPGAVEVCDPLNVDEDCDALADDTDPSVTGKMTWYADRDGDGHGDPAAPGPTACDGPSGTASVGDDCDDTDATIHPGTPEVCDPLDVDEDCDGFADDADPDVTGTSTWRVDADSDGFGDVDDAGVDACDGPFGTVADGTDCDDALASVNPSAPELCNRADDDCDGVIDDNAIDETAWHSDGDGDGFGAITVVAIACNAPPRAIADGTDCNDRNARINPDADEVCNLVDDDCDGTIDVGAIDARAWYADGDADGYGVDASVLDACTLPAGYASLGGDCDDADTAIHPFAPEGCTDPDLNCDGSTGSDDRDQDGAIACNDCDDGDATAFPGGTEVCDGSDNDCDTVVDEPDAIDAPTWFIDADIDGTGTAASLVVACDRPIGYSALDGDCDDADPQVNPDAPEVCNAIDDDCDGVIDGDAIDALVWYVDADGDGYGDPDTGLAACDAPVDGILDGTDCDDADPDVNPAAAEVDNGVDDDCDGAVDEGFDTGDTGDTDDTDVIDTGAGDTDTDTDTGFPTTSDRTWTPPEAEATPPTGCGCAAEGRSLAPFGAVVAAFAALVRRRRPALG